MSEAFFPTVDTWLIPPCAVDRSWDEMARDGRDGNEGIALWLGSHVNGHACVRAVLALRGPGIIKKPSVIQIDSALFNDVADIAEDRGMILLGHIHSHGGTFVDLSPTDRAYGVGVPHYLSVVAPYFALRPPRELEGCGTHVFHPRGYFRRLPPREVRQRIRVEGNDDVPILIVGEGS